MYCFMGVAIVSDVFMGAIEKITSKTRKVYFPADEDGEPEVIEVKIWNDTVANLTLMALGSSAPEILLSCIEIIGNNFEAGDLGPGTIVGSAAFNLLAITGVCIIAIPTGEGRSIRLIKVFFVTSTFSLFAYIWLLFILDVITPNVIDLWEAILTLLFFPLLILIGWWADRDWKWKLPPQVADKQQIKLNIDDSSAESVMDNLINKDGDVNKEGLAELCKGLRKSFPDISDTDAAVLAATTLIDTQPHSRLWYRIGACRDISGGQKIQPALNGMLREVYDTINTLPGAPDLSALPPIMTEHEKAFVEFNCASFAVPENIGEFNITVVRQGRMDNTVHVRVESFDGTAKSDSDYIPINEQIVFDPYVSEHDVTVTIIDDNQWEPDEEFFLRLSLVDEGMDRKDVTLGNLSLMQIVILNDDTPGVLSFRKRVHLVKESCKVASIEVERSKGADGEVSVQWKTLDGSAKSPQHFQGGEGTLVFKHGETLRSIDIPIINDLDSEKDACFEVELFQPTGGTEIGKIRKIAVTITNDDECNSTLRRMLNLTMDMLQSMEVHHETYKAQLRAALTVNGGDVEGATGLDYFMHFATFAWKVLFALIPPPGYFGGWPCFFSSLLFIGFLTAIIGDMASIFGCIVGLKDTVTAITFVALGTSLPDLFASKTAAAQEKYADNAIGNVTGSNSVNVFLGLGLPWVLAAIYHLVKGDDFVVQSGSLGFSVLIYSTVAFIAIALILVRRYVAFFEKAELGGPTVAKWGCGIFLFILWMVYIILSSLQAYEYFDPV